MDIKEFLNMAPKITDEIRLEMHREDADKYIFYKKSSEKIDCYCTSCMKRFTLSRIDNDLPFCEADEARFYKHGEEVMCPLCREKAIARSVAMPREMLTQYNQLIYWFVSENGQEVWMIAGILTCGYGGNKMSIEDMKKHYGGSRWETDFIYRFTPRKVERAFAHRYSGGFEFCGEDTNFYEPVTYTSYYGPRTRYESDNPWVLENSFMKYYLPKTLKALSTETDYGGNQPVKYLQYAVTYPAIEFLVKIGAEYMARQIIDNESNYKQVLNLEGRTPAEIFRCSKQEAALIRQYISGTREDPNLDWLKCFYRLKKFSPKSTIQEAAEITKWSTDWHKTLTIMKKTGLSYTKLRNYIQKQADLSKTCAFTIEQNYRDYISECEQLKYNLQDEQVSRPKDFSAVHERTSSAIRAIIENGAVEKNKNEFKQYEERYQSLCKKYAYENEEFAIIVPVGAKDIVREGNLQQHCVAGYAERHMKGVLTILFLRDKTAINKPLYTIEMNGVKCKQIQGYRNSTPLTPKAKEFYNKWLEWVALPESKKHPKEKKRRSKKETAA